MSRSRLASPARSSRDGPVSFRPQVVAWSASRCFAACARFRAARIVRALRAISGEGPTSSSGAFAGRRPHASTSPISEWTSPSASISRQAAECEAFVTFDKRLVRKAGFRSIYTVAGRHRALAPGMKWGDDVRDSRVFELSVLLWIVHVLVQATALNLTLPTALSASAPRHASGAQGSGHGGWLAGRTGARQVASRTSPPSPRLIFAFIARCHMYRPASGRSRLTILARAFYLPLYLFNVVYARSIIWAYRSSAS